MWKFKNDVLAFFGFNKLDPKHFSSAILNFSVRLIIELQKNTKSLVSSPLSAEFVLALLALGTGDTAFRDLLKTLRVPDKDAVRSSFSSLIPKLSAAGVTLSVANKVYISEGLELDSRLTKDAADVFRTKTECINFADRKAAYRINKWISRKTDNKIRTIIDDSSISDTQVALFNAIHFKGVWKTPFHSANTKGKLFYLDADTAITVPMMTLENYTEHHRFGINDLGEILGLSYEGGEASMVFVLPHEVNGLNDVLDKLGAGYDLLADVDALERQEVRIEIPKFKIEIETDLCEILPQLGIKSIFNTDLGKMLKDGNCHPVSATVQKAFIEVNEEGTDTATCTHACIKHNKSRRQRPTGGSHSGVSSLDNPIDHQRPGATKRHKTKWRPPTQVSYSVQELRLPDSSARKWTCRRSLPGLFVANRPFLYLLLGPGGTALCGGVYPGEETAPAAKVTKWSAPELLMFKQIFE